MALEQKSRDYEILIRFNDDGKIGAHRQSITEILSKGQIVMSTVDSPVSLDRQALQSIVAAFSDDDWYASTTTETAQ